MPCVPALHSRCTPEQLTAGAPIALLLCCRKPSLDEPSFAGAAAAWAAHCQYRRYLSRTCCRALLRTRPCTLESTVAACPCRLPVALHSTEPCSAPCRTPESSAMVRTRSAHRYRPRVQFSTLERDGASTSKATAAHFPDQVTETSPALAPISVLEEAQASKPPSR